MQLKDPEIEKAEKELIEERQVLLLVVVVVVASTSATRKRLVNEKNCLCHDVKEWKHRVRGCCCKMRMQLFLP